MRNIFLLSMFFRSLLSTVNWSWARMLIGECSISCFRWEPWLLILNHEQVLASSLWVYSGSHLPPAFLCFLTSYSLTAVIFPLRFHSHPLIHLHILRDKHTITVVKNVIIDVSFDPHIMLWVHLHRVLPSDAFSIVWSPPGTIKTCYQFILSSQLINGPGPTPTHDDETTLLVEEVVEDFPSLLASSNPRKRTTK